MKFFRKGLANILRGLLQGYYWAQGKNKLYMVRCQVLELVIEEFSGNLIRNKHHS